MIFLHLGGLNIVMKFANLNQSSLLILSRIYLNMVSDGGITKSLKFLDWQDQALQTCRIYLTEFHMMLDSNNCEIMDNVSVILSKLANLHCSDLQEHKRLWARIIQLSSLKSDCIGGGGDISSEAINARVSEFLLLNLNFITKITRSQASTLGAARFK
jgi:hypothetical protein